MLHSLTFDLLGPLGLPELALLPVARAPVRRGPPHVRRPLARPAHVVQTREHRPDRNLEYTTLQTLKTRWKLEVTIIFLIGIEIVSILLEC